MHAHDRTYLASLAFGDKDKQDPRHALACRYITKTDVAERLVNGLVRPEWAAEHPNCKISRAETELGIHKGTGQYMTTVGFWDAAINVEREGGTFVLAVRVEVKATKTSVDDIIRQLELYRTFSPEWSWLVKGYNHPNWGEAGALCVVALTWDLSPQETEALRRKDIHVVRLGADFDAYCAAEAEAARVPAKVVL